MICRICGNVDGNRVHEVAEMMYGTREPFIYLECATCGCLQIGQYPDNVGRYYPENYYSFDTTMSTRGLKARLAVWRNRHLFFRRNVLGALYSRFRPPRDLLNRVASLRATSDCAILDVGCGSGRLLIEMYAAGFRNLTGIDAFIAGDISPAPGLNIYKQELSSMTGKFDLIMLHHSLEHMPHQQRQLRTVADLLEDTGLCMIRVPLASSYAWRHYGKDWVQLDAPRHFYLHTPKSMELLASSVGLEIQDLQFDSNNFQFVGSELYKRGKSTQAVSGAQKPFTRVEVLAFEQRARELNAKGLGDQGVFILRKTSAVTAS